MNCSLDEWQTRLNQHFSLLHQQRGIRSLFALEHGLATAEIENLTKAVRGHVRVLAPSPMHSLVWIVYAAEVGYGYCGDEYWQTFELETPGWSIRGDRRWLRDCFEWFSRTFGGAAPKGPWANHFTIICWPITHAILPRDLQRQLARILYELRHSFSADLFESPTRLGEFIAARSWSATSRFQNLAEEPQLIGQIAAALLLQGEFGSISLLHPAALKRISADLDHERMARGWLHTARRAAQERATVRGLSFGRSGAVPTHPQPHEVREEIVTLGIEPNLVLRPTDGAISAWEPYIEIPDLSQLLIRFPHSREVLTQSRCTVTGSVGRPLARGQCLYGSQRVALKRWPRHDEVLLRFDKSDPQLEAIFRTECMLRPGPLWLFRIASDGLAHEIRNLRVRPGCRYVLVHSDGSTSVDLPRVSLACEGIVGYLIELPESLDVRWEAILNKLELRQAKAIEVWPAGLIPAQWDSDGHGEWLASERPCLGIRVDHFVNAIIVTIGEDHAMRLTISNLNPGEVAFVELPQLPVGLHTIHLSTRRSETSAIDTAGALEVLMRIRENRPVTLNGGTQGPLRARIDPVTPTLEQLWDGRAEIAFQGPNGRQLMCWAFLLDATNAIVKSLQLPSLPLPVDAATWANHFRRHFQKQKGIDDAYDMAKVCELKFTAEELGSFTLHCERESTPLRWVLRHSRNGYEVRLLNDSGASGSAHVARRSYECPQRDVRLPEAVSYDVPSAGGMYQAKLSGQIAAILAPPVIDGLGQLGCKPLVDYPGKSHMALSAAWGDAELWTAAKPSGNIFSLVRQQAVRLAIHGYTVRLLCGDEWLKTEVAYWNDTASLSHLLRAIWKVRHEADIAERLRRNIDSLSTSDMPTRIKEMERIARFLEGSHSKADDARLRWLAEFALRVASDPAEVRGWAADRLDEGTSYLLRFRSFVRAARFIVVATDNKSNSGGSSSEFLTSWRWR